MLPLIIGSSPIFGKVSKAGICLIPRRIPIMYFTGHCLDPKWQAPGSRLLHQCAMSLFGQT